MKKILLLIALMNMTQMASASEPSWNKDVLKTLNNICGDVWCSGDYQINFKKLNCNFNAGLTFGSNGACIVEFSMKEQGSNRVEENGSCVMVKYGDKDSVTKPSQNTYDPHLSNRFYEELSNCLSVWEVKARGNL